MKAYIAEDSIDGGKTWEIHDIRMHIGQAAKTIREIPWMARIREVEISVGEIVDWQIVKVELEKQMKLEQIFDGCETIAP